MKDFDPVKKAQEAISDDDSIGMKITKLLFAEFNLEKGDPVEVTKAACVLTDVLGCTLSLLKAQMPPDQFDILRAGVIRRMDTSTGDIVERGTAMREAREAAKH